VSSPHDPEELIATAEAMLADSRAASDVEFRVAALEARATGHRESRTGSPKTHMAEALWDYEEVLRLTREEDPQWSGRALNVAVAIGSQVGVDRRGAARAAGELVGAGNSVGACSTVRWFLCV
jgi:hypothetical protein